MFALGGEELGPGHHVWVLLQQGPSLPFGHPAPDTELDLVVQRICAALRDDGAVPTNHGCFPLCGAPNEEFVGVSGPTARLRHPRDACLCRDAAHGSCW